jgi:predicted ABC-type transport system involved in lysophospholipase L1 biosynthesis ATPase subunit
VSDPLELRGVLRTYRSGGGALPVLRGVDLLLRAGEIVALVAPSGAGKSTLLHLAGLLEKPDGGRVLVDGRDAGGLSDAQRTAVRRDSIGFVYQFHHLLAEFTALENVVLPQMIAGTPRRAAERRAAKLLAAFGLGERLKHPPGAYRAASSSGWRSRGHWQMHPSCCWRTNQPAIWTWRLPRWCSRNCWSTCVSTVWRRWWRRTTPTSPHAWTAR